MRALELFELIAVSNHGFIIDFSARYGNASPFRLLNCFTTWIYCRYLFSHVKDSFFDSANGVCMHESCLLFMHLLMNLCGINHV